MYRFPKDKVLKAIWLTLCCPTDNLNVENAGICFKHFLERDFERNLKYELLNYSSNKRLKLKGDAVPSQLLLQGKSKTSEITANDESISARHSKTEIENRYAKIYYRLLYTFFSIIFRLF